MGTGANNRQLSLIHMRRYFSLPSCFLWKHNAPLIKRNHNKRWNDQIKPTLPTLRKMRFYRSAVCSPHIRITHPEKSVTLHRPNVSLFLERSRKILQPPPWIGLFYITLRAPEGIEFCHCHCHCCSLTRSVQWKATKAKLCKIELHVWLPQWCPW